jgi:WD40 repeat protein
MKNIFERELLGSKIHSSNVKLPDFKPYLHTFSIRGETNFSNKTENFNDFKIFMATATDDQSLVISSIFDRKIGIVSVSPDYHTDYVTSLVWSRDNKFIFTSSEDKTVSMFDVGTDKVLKSIKTEYHGSEIKVNPNSCIIDIATGKELTLWDTRMNGTRTIEFDDSINSIQVIIFFKF